MSTEDARKLKIIFSKNLQMFLDRKGINQTDLARELGIPETTVSNWIKANTYPRIDKIQMLADFFGVSRSDLTEEKNSNWQQTTSKEETILLEHFSKLSDKGKEKTIEYAKDLSNNPIYCSEQNNLYILNAAHAGKNMTEEDIQHDEDIMNDENF